MLNTNTLNVDLYVARGIGGTVLMTWPTTVRNPRVQIERDLRAAGCRERVRIDRETLAVDARTGALVGE